MCIRIGSASNVADSQPAREMDSSVTQRQARDELAAAGNGLWGDREEASEA
jgi:hypothetical protein